MSRLRKTISITNNDHIKRSADIPVRKYKNQHRTSGQECPDSAISKIPPLLSGSLRQLWFDTNAMDFFNPREEIDKHGSRLPHWQQDSCPQFITFREHDSLPLALIRQWKIEKEQWLAKHPEPHDEATRAEYRELFTKPIEDALDRGLGRCQMRQAENRKILEDVLMHSNGEKVEHLAWIIMPNHVHLLCRPFEPIDQLIKIWKGVSSRRIGNGKLWQANYRDTMIRNERHLYRAIHYIRNNPKHLPKTDFTLWESDLAENY